MSEPFIGEIRIMGFGFAPVEWAYCSGQHLPVSQNPALYAVIGSTYGGDGSTYFNLPDLQGRAPMHPGQRSGNQRYALGEPSGEARVTLYESQLPAHTHTVQGDASDGSVSDPKDNVLAQGAEQGARGFRPAPLYSGAVPSATMDARTIGVSGSSGAHENRQPYLGLNFCIALSGVFPQRS